MTKRTQGDFVSWLSAVGQTLKAFGMVLAFTPVLCLGYVIYLVRKSCGKEKDDWRPGP